MKSRAVILALSSGLGRTRMPCSALPATPVRDDTGAVHAFAAELERCSRAADLDGFMGQVADDIVFLPPDQPAVEGAMAVREWYRAAWTHAAIDLTHDISDVVSAGDLVIAHGTATGTTTPHPGGAPVAFTNTFLFVLKHAPDGSLRAWRVTFNASAPAEPAVAAVAEEALLHFDHPWNPDEVVADLATLDRIEAGAGS